MRCDKDNENRIHAVKLFLSFYRLLVNTVLMTVSFSITTEIHKLVTRSVSKMWIMTCNRVNYIACGKLYSITRKGTEVMTKIVSNHLKHPF